MLMIKCIDHQKVGQENDKQTNKQVQMQIPFSTFPSGIWTFSWPLLDPVDDGEDASFKLVILHSAITTVKIFQY